MLKTGVYVAKNHDGSYLDRYRVTIEVKETEHSHILKLIEFDSRYAASHISSMFGSKSRIVLRKPDRKHSVMVWNETSFTMYPYPEWSATTIANRLAALRSFYRWAVSQKLIADASFLDKIQKPKIHVKRNKPSVSRAEADILRDTRRTTKNGSARMGDLRDRCLIALIYDTGIRVTEAVSLNVSHIQHMDPHRREFINVAKGGSECSWFITEPIYELLMSYLRTHPNPVSNSPLFLNRYGKRLSVRSVQKMLSARGEQVLGRHLHPHMLRRGFGNAFYEASGHDIYLTSQAMHHSSIATTQGYLSVSDDQLKQVVDTGLSRPEKGVRG